MTARIDSLNVRNLRSIGSDWAELQFPQEGALILLGENNSGKSNITRALDILFGDVWPSSRRLDEHDFHGRDSDGLAVQIVAQVSGIACPYCGPGNVTHLSWTYDQQNPTASGDPVSYLFTCSNKYCGKTFPKKEIRTALSAAVLDADRRLDYQLSYASKFTMLSKLMHRFHERLLADPARKANLTQIFSDLVAEFSGVPEFKRFKELLSDTAEDFGQNLPYRLDIDFSAYDPSNFFRSLRINPAMEGEARSFDELGTGQSQVLALAFAYAYAIAYGQSDSLILVIDEPEANLHPLAQQWLAERLNTITAPGLQLVLTTHSPYFIDLSRPQNLAIVRKSAGNGATSIVQKSTSDLVAELVASGADAGRTLADTVGPFYASAATTEILAGLFARKCVLVEGQTEALALPMLLRARGLDVLKEGIAVLSVVGIGNIAKWRRLFASLGIEAFCIFDTDSDKSGQQSINLSEKRKDIGKALGMDDDPVVISGGDSSPVTVGQTFACMNPNFEGAMRILFGARWDELDAEAAPLVGDSKPLRARYAAASLRSEEYGGAGVVLDSMVAAIRALGASGSAEPASEVEEPPPF